MSGQWEVVGKKNKPVKNVPLKEPKKNKQAAQNGPKVEEVLPVSQIKSLFKSEKTVISNNKENNKKPKENAAKKPKKPDNKPPEPPKQKPPKNIESALNGISADEFKKVFESSRAGFPDMPIVWLKELAQFLNQKIPVEVPDPVFKSKPFGYPLSAVPTPLKAIIDRAVKEAGKSNVQTFFNISLTAMATDMSRNSSALGHKLLLQYIALHDPKSAATNLSNYITLRNSYQNRPPIGLSILWAVGQVGEKDIHLGLKVFSELMLPLIEMKNYSRYIVEYLLHVLRQHKEAPVTKDEFFLLLDTIFSKRKYPSDVVQQLNKAAVELSGLFDRNKDTKRNIFVEVLLKKLPEVDNQNQKVLCELLANCFVKDQNSYASWNKIYAKYLIANTALINHFSKNWADLSSKINKSQLTDALVSFSIVNEDLQKKKRKEPGLNDAIAAIKSLETKMTTITRRSGFPFRKWSFFLLLALGTLVYYDCRQHGGWKNSNLLQFLNSAGLTKYFYQASGYLQKSVAAVDTYALENYPEFYPKFKESFQLYVKLTKNLGLVVYNQCKSMKEFAIGKYPILLETVESYAPGLIQQSQNAVNQAVSVSVFYFNSSVDYLKNEIFVGQLSPENMQKVVTEALNTTQQKAVEYYQWLYEKIRVSV